MSETSYRHRNPPCTEACLTSGKKKFLGLKPLPSSDSAVIEQSTDVWVGEKSKEGEMIKYSPQKLLGSIPKEQESGQEVADAKCQPQQP